MDHFAEEAQEFGLSADDLYYAGQMDYGGSDSMDDIELSSPSPPERRVRDYQYQSYPSQIYRQRDDDIAQYELEDYQQQTLQHYQTTSEHSFRFTPDPGLTRGPHHHEQLTIQSQPRRQPASQFPEFARYSTQSDSAYTRGSNPRNSHGIRLHPVSELPDIYRGIFKFGVFNAVQSTCFDSVLHSDENMVISAPTGSGKTVLFELAIIRMLQSPEGGGRAKCVYMAPTKALCSERYRDWTTKFEGLGVKCCELTGDTVQFGKSAWGDANSATIIITTGEKWDSLTRNWRGNNDILSRIQLFLVDEVHILHESRGSTLEVVISRMKTRGSSVRFVLVSATVPNIGDVSDWIGIGGRESGSGCYGARIFEFGEEFRPCKLTRHVYGSNRPKGQHDFVFSKTLDYRLFPVLQQHAVGKPILVFCSTRKGVLGTAQHLAKEYQEAVKKKGKLPWSQPNFISYVFHDKRLGELAASGIGIHHAGLSMDDRKAIEDLFLKKVLRIVVATSTLAVGVNLPAHMVVIKGVHTWHNNASHEYSDLDVMQMLGRAGRPQFDKDGIAIILCETELEHKYKALVQGKTILESCLHLNLSEHLNSEIGLGTITDIPSAKEWLRNSFLFRRIQKNPEHYDLGLAREGGIVETWEEKMGDLVMRSVEKLQATELVAYEADGSGRLGSTEYGDIMSKLYIRQSTMSLILKLPPRATLREIMVTMCSCEELGDLKLRSTEKTIYNKLRQHNDIRFEIKKVEKTSDKVFLLIQAVLGGIPLNAPEFKSSDSQPYLEAFTVFRHIVRIARAVVEVAIAKKIGAQIKHGMELVRCLTAKAWEDRPTVLRQIEQIGEKSLKVLAEHGITSLETLRKQNPLKIETLLNRRSPFGYEVISSANEFPQYSLSVTEVELCSNDKDGPIEVELSIECGLAVEQTTAGKFKKQKNRSANMTAVLTLTSDLDLVDFRRIPTKMLKDPKTFNATAQLTKPSQSVCVYMTSESVAGVTITQVYKPNIDASAYPTMDTRPLSSLEMDIASCNEDPNFWNNLASDSEEDAVIKDLTISHPKTKATIDKYSIAQNTTTILQTIDRLPLKPRKRADGTYECNHACKDKTKCRHLCCRDGLEKPPAASSKKKASNAEKDGVGSTQTVSTPEIQVVESKPRSVHKARPTTRPDRRLQQLESLHERSNVSLRLPEGNRLKLPQPPPTRKGRIVANFDLELADITDPVDSRKDMDIDNDEDEDLPAPYELLNEVRSSTGEVKATPSLDTNYSNSEIDSLARNVPLEIEDDPALFPKSPNFTNSSSRYRPIPATPVHSSKRALVVDENEVPPSPAKRSKRKAFDDNLINLQFPLSVPMTSTHSTLFFPGSDDVNELPKQPSSDDNAFEDSELQCDENEFSLDYDRFEILPATSTQVLGTPALFPRKSDKPHFISLRTEAKPVATKRTSPSPVLHASELLMSTIEPTDPHDDDDDDPLAEFNAWVEGGGVIILPES